MIIDDVRRYVLYMNNTQFKYIINKIVNRRNAKGKMGFIRFVSFWHERHTDTSECQPDHPFTNSKPIKAQPNRARMQCVQMENGTVSYGNQF